MRKSTAITLIIAGLYLMILAACGSSTTVKAPLSPIADSVAKSKHDTVAAPKYHVGQYVWIDGVTKAYVYKDNVTSCGCGNNASTGIGEKYYVAYASQSGNQLLTISENRLFESPDTFYHKIVLPERLYQQIASEKDSLFDLMITTQRRVSELENKTITNNR